MIYAYACMWVSPLSPVRWICTLSTRRNRLTPAALPANLDDVALEYQLDAGQMAMHSVMIPHPSKPNTSATSHRVLVIRYVSADCVLGCETYQGHATAEGPAFEREYFLVAGEDLKGVGFRRYGLLLINNVLGRKG